MRASFEVFVSTDRRVSLLNLMLDLYYINLNLYILLLIRSFVDLIVIDISTANWRCPTVKMTRGRMTEQLDCDEVTMATCGYPGYLPFTWENRKFQLEDQMVHAIPFGKLQKIWALISGDAIFLLFEVSLADVDRLFCDSLSRNVAFKCLMFMPENFNRMVFVNGKHP